MYYYNIMIYVIYNIIVYYVCHIIACEEEAPTVDAEGVAAQLVVHVRLGDISLSLSLSLYIYISLYMYVHLSLYLYISLSLLQYIYIYIHMYIYIASATRRPALTAARWDTFAGSLPRRTRNVTSWRWGVPVSRPRGHQSRRPRELRTRAEVFQSRRCPGASSKAAVARRVREPLPSRSPSTSSVPASACCCCCCCRRRRYYYYYYYSY